MLPTRRGALSALGGVGITVLLAACAKSSSADTTTASSTATAASTDTTAAARTDTTAASTEASAAAFSTAVASGSVVLATELTEGPYYLDLDLVRSDIVEDREGGKLALGLRVTQLSDATGLVSFATIYPGWYTGRTLHIHVKVHVDGSVIHVGQLFFDVTFTDAVYAADAPYSSRSASDLRNDSDGIFQQGGANGVLAVAKSGTGYAAALAIGVQNA